MRKGLNVQVIGEMYNLSIIIILIIDWVRLSSELLLMFASEKTVKVNVYLPPRGSFNFAKLCLEIKRIYFI